MCGLASSFFQAVHYFARPHDGIIRQEPIVGRVAWRGEVLGNKPSEWRTELSTAQQAELRDMVTSATSTALPLEELSAGDCPLSSSLIQLLDTLRGDLNDDLSPHALGFHVIRGVPVDGWSLQQRRTFFWCLGLHLGVPGTQNKAGDLLGNVRDTGADPRTDRFYLTHAAIPYHCDAAQVVGLLCLRPAPSGGTSRIVSSVSVYNAMLERHPDKVARLYEPFPMDTRGSSPANYVPVEMTQHYNGTVRTFYNTGYLRSAYRHADAPHSEMPSWDKEVLDAYDAVTMDPRLYLDMELQRGDVQLLNNHVVLHSRTEYEDGDSEDTKRHLLRLWLTLKPSSSSSPSATTTTSWYRKLLVWRSKATLATRFAWGGMRSKLYSWGLQ